MTNILDTRNEYRDRVRIEVENLVPWQVGFRGITIQSLQKGVVIDGFSKFRQLTLEEVVEQISSGNVVFCGVDGKGAHACFRITDFDLYKVAFDLPNAKDYPIQLTKEEIDKLLKIKELKKFKLGLDELVVTDSEKKAFTYMISNRPEINDIPLSFIKAMEDKTGLKIVE